MSDEVISRVPLFKPGSDASEMQYLHERRRALGGYVPSRRVSEQILSAPAVAAFDPVLRGSEGRAMSTTMAFVRLLTALTRDRTIGKHIVPIVPDEARTFGMEGLFRQLGIYAAHGQSYDPVDSAELMPYREDKKGQILEEGICEAGAVSSFIAAGTSYANYGVPMIPFYAFYSMFGFQRVGDFLWAAADACARGFLVGATSGRTTLAGEGLQHTDGHSHVLASTIPSCRSYDPAYGYELAVIVHEGLHRMYEQNENVFYYVTVTNEQYAMPAIPESAREGIVRGMYLLQSGSPGDLRVQLLGSGAILREVLEAAELLESQYGVRADVWSVTSFTELRRNGDATRRELQMHPDGSTEPPYVESLLEGHPGPVIAATDYMKIHADQIRPFVPRRYITLGTDGFGRSDTRERLRRFFEVDRYYIAYAALHALHCEGDLSSQRLLEARAKLGIDPQKASPVAELV